MPSQSHSLLVICLSLIAVPSINAQMTPDESQQLLDANRGDADSVNADDIDVPAKHRLATSYDELSTASQIRLKRYSQYCVRIGGDIWSNEVERDRKRQTTRLRRVIDDDGYIFAYNDGRTRSGFVDPYEVYGSPVYVCLTDRRMFLNIESIQNQIKRTVLEKAGAIDTPFIVNQVLENGVRARWGDDEFYVEMETDGVVEDQKFESVIQDVGTYEYITVLGASRTVQKYRVISLEYDIAVTKISPSELFEYMVRQRMTSFPIYRPKVKIEKRPYTKSGGGSVKGRYKWDWRLIEQPIDLYVDSYSQ